jgi:hypothetical protein
MTPLRRKIATSAEQLIETAQGLGSCATGVDWFTGAPCTALDALEWPSLLREHLDELEALIVRQARVEQASWAQIAEPSGMTRQGAQQRWG